MTVVQPAPALRRAAPGAPAMAAQLRALVAQPLCHAGPSIFDGLSARLAERAGARFVHASGGSIARAIGFPDVGLVTMDEMLGRIGEMTEALSIPLVADADTGYGNAHNAARAARLLARLGVAGLHIEDQTFPKRCGYYDSVSVIPVAEMVDKVRAMRDAVGDDLVIIARTDAKGSEGLSGALDRMGAYLEAGAEIAFVEGLHTLDEVRSAARALAAPQFLNQPNSARPLPWTMEDLAAANVRLAIYPAELQRAAIEAMCRTLAAIMRDGDTQAVADLLCEPQLRDDIVETKRYLA